MKIVILGLSITSSWGNGHATTYRALVRTLTARRHDVLFLERNMPWYAGNRDLPTPPYGRTELYNSIGELEDRFDGEVREADIVIVGSYVPEGVAAGVVDGVLLVVGGALGWVALQKAALVAALARAGWVLWIAFGACYLFAVTRPSFDQIRDRAPVFSGPLGWF